MTGREVRTRSWYNDPPTIDKHDLVGKPHRPGARMVKSRSSPTRQLASADSALRPMKSVSWTSRLMRVRSSEACGRKSLSSNFEREHPCFTRSGAFPCFWPDHSDLAVPPAVFLDAARNRNREKAYDSLPTATFGKGEVIAVSPVATSTDIEEFIEAPGRQEQVDQIMERIEAEGIKYLYCQFVSVTGRIMGKGIPAKHFKMIANKGFQLVYGSTANLFTDRHGNYIGYGPEARELVGVAEPETFTTLPWDPKTARVFCTLFRGREEKVNGGAFLTADCRGNLKRIHAEFEASTGLHLRAGTEPEMMWLKLNADGSPSVNGMTKPNCYHIDQFAELQPLIHKVIEYSEAMGLDMIQGDHEDAPGQLELNFQFDRAELTADRLTTYRQVCKQVGRELGAFPTFMPKPFMGVSANGCHHNISLWEGDTNKFLPEGDDPQMPGQIGLWAIGGILKHVRALTCLSSPTVNSYRRLWDTGFWAPVFADWGFQNRTTALRVSSPDRFEYRSVDSSVNPYLSFAGLLKAMEDGIVNKIDPGPPEERNIYEAMEQGKDVSKIPLNLGEALEALDDDEVIKSALPDEMYKVFHHYKIDEWERFLATVTEWDVNEYLDILP